MIERTAALAAALAAAAVPAGAQGGKWTPVSFGGSPKVSQVYFVDPASIVRKGTSVSFRSLIVYAKPSERGVDRAVEKSAGDCRDRSTRALEVSFYLGSEFRFKVGEQAETERYPAGTPWRILVDSVCDSDLPAMTTADPAGWARAKYFSR